MSTSESYVPILEGDRHVQAQSNKSKGGCSTAKALALAVALATVAAVVTFAITKHHYKTDSTSTGYDRTKRFVAPESYTMTGDFRIPYIEFTEDLTVTANADQMRVAYYGGANTYIYGKNESYTVTPVFDKLECTKAGAVAPGAVFPDMSSEKFVLQDGTQRLTTRGYPQGVDCDVWAYNYSHITQDTASNATAEVDNADGYAGSYFFYVRATDGVPVSFRARYGHNVVLGGSHYDEYHLDYVTYTVLEQVDPLVFAPPSGMTCGAGFTPSGPTRTHEQHARDLDMLFPHGEEHRAGAFEAYLAEHGKAYPNAAERRMRAGIFHNSARFINSHNRKGATFTLALNHLADLTPKEIKARNGYRVNKATAETVCQVWTPKTIQPLPNRVDWRGKSLGGLQNDPGFVNPAADQGTCGSCWTFGAATAGEAAHYKKHGQLIKLSQQNMLDCSWNGGNMACDGGGDFLGYQWLLEHNNGSWAELTSYGGYRNQNSFCHYAKDINRTVNPWTGAEVAQGTQLKACYHVATGFNETLPIEQSVGNFTQALVQEGVLSVAIDATLPTFYFYKSGYFYDPKCSNTELDHQVTAVGYTTYQGHKYAVIRNSWSDHWGENGFVNLRVDNCGVSTQATFVEVY